MSDNREQAQALLVWYFNQTLKKAARGQTEFDDSGQDEIRAIVSYLIAAAVDEIKPSSETVSTKPEQPAVETGPLFPGDTIQEAQMLLGKLQTQYRDHDPGFWALAVAWEAARFAWYVVTGELGTARDKLQLAEEAITNFKRNLPRDRGAFNEG